MNEVSLAINFVPNGLGSIIEYVPTNSTALHNASCVNVFADYGELIGTFDYLGHFDISCLA
jgi:hypothetical protein